MADKIMYSDLMITFICDKRKKGRSWDQIAAAFNEEFKTNISYSSIRRAYLLQSLIPAKNKDIDLSLAKENRAIRRTNHRLRSESNAALDALTAHDEIYKAIGKLLNKWEFEPINVATPPKPKAKGKKAILELLLSDLHIGQKTDSFNFAVARKRLVEIRETFLFEVKKAEGMYTLDKIILAMLGDMIHSYEFHGLASAITCEDTTEVQTAQAIDMLFWEIIKPIAELGYPIEIPAVPGNHDRTSKERKVYRPGEESVTHVIYRCLEMLCRTTGLNNVTWTISKESYIVSEIFGKKVLYSHGVGTKLTPRGIEDSINDRQTQLRSIIDFYRFGHWHSYNQFGRGRAICNATLVSGDGYSDELGYAGEAGQTISLYVETTRRKTPFYWSYLCSVENVK